MKKQKKLSIFFSSVSKISNIYYEKIFSKYIKKEFHVLDFGCGTGELLKYLNCKYKLGVEINKYSQSYLKKNKINFTNNLKSVKKKFDVVFALSVIDHLKNPNDTIKQLVAKLKKNGKLIIIIRQDSKNQKPINSSYKEHLYSWSLLSFSNLINTQDQIKLIDSGILKFTLVPFFNFFKNFLSNRKIIFLSKIYYYLNFKDRRLFFIIKKL
jgi:SAM-dependent methyltransferase